MAAPLSLSGPHVIDYEHLTVNGRLAYEPVEFADSVRSIKQGVRMPSGGCEFTSAGVGVTEGFVEVELAYDRDTCRTLVETGTPAHSDQNPDDGAATSIAGASSVSKAAGDGPALTHLTYWARATQQYDEPARWVPGTTIDEPGILPPVTRALNYVQWTPDGSCAIAPGTTGWFGYLHEYYATSGWEVESNTWTHTPDGACRSQIFSESQLDFRNNDFCAYLASAGTGFHVPPFVWDFFIADTYTKYHPNHISGNANGTYNYNMTSSKGGGCNDLLRRLSKHERITL